MTHSSEISPLDAKWGAEVMGGGFVALPTYLLQRQAKFGLTPLQVNVLMHLIDHWFDPGRWPFPSNQTLARRMGTSQRTVQRAMQDLERRGFLVRRKQSQKGKGQTSNMVDLSGLVTMLRTEARAERPGTTRKDREPKRMGKTPSASTEIARQNAKGAQIKL